MTEPNEKKKILYIDMDNTLVDFKYGISRLSSEDAEKYKEAYDDAPGIFGTMIPLDGAIEAFTTLSKVYDTYILSTAPWNNPSAWSDKLEWVQKHFGKDEDTPAWKRLILSHHKNLNHGDYIVDDRDKNGVKDFNGTHIHFGSVLFPDWPSVTNFLLDRARQEL
ncbi:UNVERIFIED_CONTAM: 5'(3')-deoxyribonucleotidase [Williamsia faeni]